jgi:predicted ATPase/class 3 adenylate cyclase
VEVTLLVTDIEGSTRAWEADEDLMSALLERHDVIVREAIEGAGGTVFKHTGDGFASAFDDVKAAVSAAVLVQKAVSDILGDLKVRAAVYTGRAQRRDGDYFGSSHNRAARLLAAGVGGQILLAGESQDPPDLPPDVTLDDLGALQLRDVHDRMQVYRVSHPDLGTSRRTLRALDHLRTNMPSNPSTFLGREAETERIVERLADNRLVTLVGPGGVGKTALATFVGNQILHLHPDGVWFCELAAARDSESVPAVVAGDLGLVQDELGSEDLLISRLLHKRCVIILDNCEHLLAATANLAEKIVRHCPMTSVIATSRAPLGLVGEAVERIEPLPFGSVDSPAVLLFMERARAVRNGIEFGPKSMDAIVQICEHLDGLPLAIELAAARTRTMSPIEVNERLTNRFNLLVGGQRDATGRQQTLASAVDWSYDLCSAEEKALFNRLSVFAGGFTLAVAEEVCSGDGVARDSLFDRLDSLVDKSLVVARHGDDRTRYRLLEILRAYGAEKLAGDGMEAVYLERHATYFADFAERMCEQAKGPAEIEAADQFIAEYDNLDVASSRAVKRGDTDVAMRIAAHMFHLAYELQRMEVFARCERTLEMEGALKHPLASAVEGLAAMGRGQRRDWEGGVELANRAIQRGNWSHHESILPHYARTQVALWTGQILEAIEWTQAMVESARRGDSDWALARALGHAAWATCLHDPSSAYAYSDEAMECARRTRNPSTLALVHWYTAQVYLHDGRHAEALRATRRASALAEPTRNRVVKGVARQLEMSLQDALGDQRGRWESALDSIRMLSTVGDMTFFAGVTILQVVDGFAKVGRFDVVHQTLARLTPEEREIIATLGSELPEVVEVLESETTFVSPLSDAEFSRMLIEEIEAVVDEFANGAESSEAAFDRRKSDNPEAGNAGDQPVTAVQRRKGDRPSVQRAWGDSNAQPSDP